jgi:hypothetical protein
VSTDVVTRHNTPIIIGVFVGFSRIFLLGIVIFKGLIARRLYKSFGFKGLMMLWVLQEKPFPFTKNRAINFKLCFNLNGRQCIKIC